MILRLHHTPSGGPLIQATAYSHGKTEILALIFWWHHRNHNRIEYPVPSKIPCYFLFKKKKEKETHGRKI